MGLLLGFQQVRQFAYRRFHRKEFADPDGWGQSCGPAGASN